MIPASDPVQRPHDAKLLVVGDAGNLRHVPRSSWIELLQAGDLVVANDAATIPASLFGLHVDTQRAVEVRLAGRRSLDPEDVHEFTAVIFGEGDFHTRTEDRPAPPRFKTGDRLELGPLLATVARLLGHPRLVAIRFEGSADRIWAGLARHGRPIQYAHLDAPLSLWDVWTPIAGPPAAFEPPSAGFVIDWNIVAALRARGVWFTTITHAAGISSTGDSALDACLPFDEPYRIPEAAAAAIRRTRERSGAGRFGLVRASLQNASALARGYERSTRFSRGPTSREPAIMNCCAPSPMTGFSNAPATNSICMATERMNFGDSVMLEAGVRHFQRVGGAP